MPNDDTKTFRRAMAGVTPRPATPPPPARPKPRATAQYSRAAGAAQLWEQQRPPWDPVATQLGDAVACRRPGVRDEVLRRLRRGKVPVEGEIDLHGLALHGAHDALRGFLALAVARRLRCVRVIHGKGLRSGAGGPVLRLAVTEWLRRIEHVVAFASALPAEGGTGALYVLLAVPGDARSRRTP